ncbi:MAG: NYN domain-containing protein [Elusimicrobia bacterium]|nr:NYN domain-containing protein [Elusimicrobiota bacterium]
MNLATHLLFDAFKNKYDTAVVISNDSDLAESIRLSGSIGKKIGVLNPHRERPSRKLLSVCSFF